MRNTLLFRCMVLIVAVVLLPGIAQSLELVSDAFEERGTIPIKYTSKGENISPPLSWSDVPKGTKSFALIMEDPDAPMGTWIHWVIYDIPGDSRELNEGTPGNLVLEDGTRQGINSFRWAGYGGPAPPPGSSHRYFFRLYALDTVLDLAPGANKGLLTRTMQGNILGQTRLIGIFPEPLTDLVPE
jgi:Raf kinase inhibitor-like YbhB/YbcL family protein